MTLVPGVAESFEYPLQLDLKPRAVKAGQKVRLTFTVRNPVTGRRVTDFELMHEKLYHLFLISQDLEFFVHDHPRQAGPSTFTLDAVLPRSGMYRILSDFYPRGGTPQLIAQSIIVPGGPVTAGTLLTPDVRPQKSRNLEVSLQTEPAQAVAGMKTILFFDLDTAAGLELFLGAWAHMLVASGDLIDLIHTHPFLADGGPRVQFNVIFPRAGVYRVWVQLQRRGIVNTVAFNIPVTELGAVQSG